MPIASSPCIMNAPPPIHFTAWFRTHPIAFGITQGVPSRPSFLGIGPVFFPGMS